MASNKKPESAEKNTDEICQIDATVMQDFRVSMDRRVDDMNAAVHDITGSMRRMNGEMRQISRPMDFFPLNKAVFREYYG